jgi:hypothetical protein
MKKKKELHLSNEEVLEDLRRSLDEELNRFIKFIDDCPHPHEKYKILESNLTLWNNLSKYCTHEKMRILLEKKVEKGWDILKKMEINP